MKEIDSPWLRGFQDGVKPPPEKPLRDLINDLVYLPNSPEGAKYSTEAVPAHAYIWDWIEDRSVYEIDVIACVGFGKSALLEAWSTDIIGINPGDTLILGQTRDMIQDWMSSRLRKVLEASPITSGYIPKGNERNNWKKDQAMFRHMNFFTGAANMTDTQEKSMVNTGGDEAWRWDFGIIGYLRARHHGRWNRKSILLSQASVEGTEWHQDATSGKWHDLEHICPDCGEGHVFDFGNFDFKVIRDGNEEFDWPAIFERIRFVCPSCKSEFEDTEYNRRQWSKCRPVWNGNKHIPGRMTLRATFMTVWRYQWRDVVKKWIIANEEKKQGQLEKLEQIVCQDFCQFWKPPSDTPELNTNGDPYSKQEHHEGEAWEGEDFRFMTVDVQKGHFWAVIRAWKMGGASRLLWEGRVDAYENLRHLQERYGLENRFVFIDCGYKPEEVAKEARLSQTTEDTRPWNLLRGEEAREGYMKKVNEKRYRRVHSDFMRSDHSEGFVYRYVKFSNLLCKDRLAAMMGDENFGIPVDASKQYHAQMQSEQKNEISPGVWRWVSKKKASAANNHLWDCEVMQVVAACLYKVLVAQEAVEK